MKLLLLFAPAIALFTACNNNTTTATSEAAAPKNTDWIQQHLQGKVETLTETTYTADSTGKMGKMDSVIGVTDYDEKGYVEKYQEKDSAGTVRQVQVIKHDERGHFTEMTTTKDGKQISKMETELDASGNYSGGKTYDTTGKQDSYYKNLKTNEYGIVYAGERYGMNDKIKETWNMKYDKTAFLGGTVTDSTGKPTYESTVKVNDKGEPVEEAKTTRQKDSTKTEKLTYKYDTFDDKGNWTQRTTYNERGTPTKITKRTISYYKD